MASAPTAVRQDSYSCERAAFGGISLITLHGTLNDQFEGVKLANSIKNKKVVLHLRDVSRYASWGMSEWMDFLRSTAECDVYLVECSTYAVSQLNLVTGLLGHAKLVSFYASYRCTSCNAEQDTRFIIPRDRAIIPDIPGSFQDCTVCGARARLDEYPAAFFDTIAARQPFDIDDEVLAFMRQHLRYDLSPDLTRFRAYSKQHKGYTYIRLTGNVATLPPEVLARASSGTTVVDLDGLVFEPAMLATWRAYVDAAMPKVSSLQLVGCPTGFLESAVTPQDFQNKLKVRTFAMGFTCGTCDKTNDYTVDVASNLEQLALGQVPIGRCPSCRSALTPITNERLVQVLRALPARDRDVALDMFLNKCRGEPAEKLDNALVAAKPAAPVAPKRRAPYLAASLGLLVAAAGGGAWYMSTHQREPVKPAPVPVTAPVVNPGTATEPTNRPTFTRPDWISSDVPSSGYCHDLINRITCVGVSGYRTNREDGASEAAEAALEELTNTVALKMSDPFFRDTVAPAYTTARRKAISQLQDATLNRNSDAAGAAAYVMMDESVRRARKRVVAALQASGGAAVPAQRADWYWEEYAGEAGGPNEYVVFVRYDLSLDSVRALVDKYSASTQVLGATVMTAFPALGWQHVGFEGGALVVKPGDRLGKVGVAPMDLVVAVDGQPIVDVSGLAQRTGSLDKPATLTVVTGDTAGRPVIVKK